MISLTKAPRLSLAKTELPPAIYIAGIVPHVTLAQMYSSLKDMRRYTIRAVYKGRATMLNLEPMPYKQAMIMRGKYGYCPNRSIEIIRLH